MYRVLEHLSVRGERIPLGAVLPLKNISTRTLKKLEAMGRISKVKGPPLTIVQNFGEYVDDLADVDINDLVSFVEADPETLTDALGMPADEVAELQDDNKHFLLPTPPEEQSWVLSGDD